MIVQREIANLHWSNKIRPKKYLTITHPSICSSVINKPKNIPKSKTNMN